MMHVYKPSISEWLLCVNPIIHCEDGDEALAYLFCRGRFAPPAHAPLPGIIPLDLNLPGIDGHEVLEAV